jgi:small subunit ribosomal protein S10
MVPLIEISLKSYEFKLIENSYQQILNFIPPHWTLNSTFFPNKIKKITLLRSPHIDKKSREQFEMKILKRKINIECSTLKDSSVGILAFQKIYLFLENIKQCPFSGVQIQIQVLHKSYI